MNSDHNAGDRLLLALVARTFIEPETPTCFVPAGLLITAFDGVARSAEGLPVALCEGRHGVARLSTDENHFDWISIAIDDENRLIGAPAVVLQSPSSLAIGSVISTNEGVQIFRVRVPSQDPEEMGSLMLFIGVSPFDASPSISLTFTEQAPAYAVAAGGDQQSARSVKADIAGLGPVTLEPHGDRWLRCDLPIPGLLTGTTGSSIPSEGLRWVIRDGRFWIERSRSTELPGGTVLKLS